MYIQAQNFCWTESLLLERGSQIHLIQEAEYHPELVIIIGDTSKKANYILWFIGSNKFQYG